MAVEPRYAYLDLPRPHVFAHRGGNEAAPENTLAAFSHAYELGVRYLETDVHLTRDGVLVAFHDVDLQRVAGLGGTIADHTWDELADIELPDGTEGSVAGTHRIPTLDALLDAFGDARFNIDPKADDTVGPLADTIRDRGLVDRVCVGSFSDARVAEIRDLVGPDLCTSPGPWGVARIGSLALVPPLRRLVDGHPHGCVQVPYNFKGLPLTRPVVDAFHRLGLLVHVWTVNDADRMVDLLDMGVDGLMSDRVELLTSVVDEWAAR
ncbi:MAG: glycerophosphodiester phosphodiesterase [Acidimicrobiales bacterium]